MAYDPNYHANRSKRKMLARMASCPSPRPKKRTKAKDRYKNMVFKLLPELPDQNKPSINDSETVINDSQLDLF